MEISKKQVILRGRELTLALLIVFVIVVVSFLKKGVFLNVTNFEAILIGLAYDLMIAIGMTIVLILGGIDLSVGSVLAFVGIITTLLLQDNVPIPLAIFTGLAAAGLIGALNGIMIVKAKIPPFVMTLGSMSFFRGLCFVLTSGYFVNKLPENYVKIGRGALIGISNNVLVAFAILIVIVVLIKRSKYFRQMFYIGASPRAAFLSGIPSGNLMIFGYVLCSLLAGLAGILMTSRLAMGHAGFGGGAELRAIAAAVIGGASMAGGEGSILGTALGVVVIALINNVFIMFNGSSNWQAAISGLALIIAISIDVLRNRLKKQTN